MKNISYLFILFAALSSFQANAHVKLVESIPEKDGLLLSAPEQLTLKFSASTRIAKLKIHNTNGDIVDIGFRPIKTPSAEFSWDLPRLSAGTYQVEIIYFGNDGHKMKTNYSFIQQ